MSPRVYMLGSFACVMVFHTTIAGASVIKLDATEYWTSPGGTFNVDVMYEVTEPSIAVSNAGFRLESFPDVGVPGQLTTSTADVNQSLLLPYIFEPNAGFFDTGSGGIVATGR